MKSFTQHLTESVTTGKVRFLTHLEDTLIENGSEGVDFSLTLLRQFGAMLEGGAVPRGLNLTTKWDGAPAVVFGPDPDDGEFFVATKAAFNKSPKLLKTHKDVDKHYGGQTVAPFLHACLDHLKKLRPPTILQGDLLFAGDVAERVINGQYFLTFKPNTIMYAVDKQSDLGKSISFAKIGIVVHTMYTGKGRDILAYNATPITPIVFAGLKPSVDVVIMDATYDDVSGTATFTHEQQSDFDLALTDVENLAGSLTDDVYAMFSTEPVRGLVKTFINQRVRGNQAAAPKAQDFLDFLDETEAKELERRSSDKGKQTVSDSFAQMVTTVVQQKKNVARWFKLHNSIANAKNLVVKKLGEVSKVQSFIPQEDGSFKVTGPEGFVATSRAGKMVKLVDRLEFSRQNMLYSPMNK